MKSTLLKTLLLGMGMYTINASAHPATDSSATRAKPAPAPFHIGGAMDGLIFSTALIDHTGSQSLGTLRFSAFFHIGFTFNFNFSRHFGAYTGIDLKNVGFIEKVSDYTIKRRVYNVGVPVGLKIGNLSPGGTYFFLGGGADVPVNYKEKVKGPGGKTKFNEWFSDRTPHIMPYAFAGLNVHSFTFKAQYYPSGFFNQDYTSQGIKPYADYDVNMLLFSLGYNTSVSRHKAKHKTPDNK